MKRNDLQWNTYDIGRFKSGTVIHLPTGNFVHWTTNREHPSEWRARVKAEEELQKLVEQYESTRQTYQEETKTTNIPPRCTTC